MTWRQDPESWKRGFAAGREGELDRCPFDVADKLSWWSGFIEGRRAARKTRASSDRVRDLVDQAAKLGSEPS